MSHSICFVDNELFGYSISDHSGFLMAAASWQKKIISYLRAIIKVLQVISITELYILTTCLNDPHLF